jgi:small-conductance mechanosensitive channel
MFDTNAVIQFATELNRQLIEFATSPLVYAQLGMILIAVITALSLAASLKRRSSLFRETPQSGPLLSLRRSVHGLSDLLFPLLNVLLLSIGVEITEQVISTSWLVRIATSLSVVFLIYSIISRYIKQQLVRALARWIAIPVAVLQVFGWLEPVTGYLDTIDLNIGNIHVSAYAIIRVVLFGSILFWLGRVSSRTGQRIIRRQTDLHVGTREVLAKLFEVGLFVVVFLLLLQVMGINLTALAVFGGALGVGIGLGLQSIASNFVSGIIILLDRSITIGDYVEFEDGKAGVVREMNMRSTVLETFDGKDIVVPNEKFINNNVTNWTHKDNKQRYSLNIQVAYRTDLDLLFELIREVCRNHPKVLSGEDYPIEEQPDAEIQSFDDSGITILVEFWIRGIDDGKNRVGADLLHAIWTVMQERGIEIPFPQREVRVLNEGSGFPASPGK